LKLYNASSFFAPRSIDQSDGSFREIANELSWLDLVVVEARSENAEGAVRLSSRLSARLEVAIGFETADDGLLQLLNKPTSVSRFRKAARFLWANGISLRAFVLVGPPFVAEADARRTALEALEEARRQGARVVSLLPVVSEHEPMEALRRAEFFSEVSTDEFFETVFDGADRDRLRGSPGAVLIAELESLERLPGCPHCRGEKARRLERLNATGRIQRFACRDHQPSAPVRVRRPPAGDIGSVLTALEKKSHP